MAKSSPALSLHECEFISKFKPWKNKTESQEFIERKPVEFDVRVSPGESLADLSVTFFYQVPKGFMKVFTQKPKWTGNVFFTLNSVPRFQFQDI